jgi:hypothetical protein
MDITKYNTTVASDKAQTMSLKDPFTDEVLLDENGETIDIYLYGIQSTAARNAVAERERKSNKKDLTEEETNLVGAEFLAALTVGWSDNIEVNGKKLKYDHKNAISLYLEQDWIGQQVISFVSNLENYAPKA